MENFNFEGFNANDARESADLICEDSTMAHEVSHDDGNMHVSLGGTRYVFDIGQEVSSSQYNREANRILRQIGVSGLVRGQNN